MSSRKPIRFSTWTLVHRKNKNDKRVARDIIVSGDKSDLLSMKTNSLYLGRVYTELFNKKSFLKKVGEDNYNVTRIELDDKILGYTNV